MVSLPLLLLVVICIVLFLGSCDLGGLLALFEIFMFAGMCLMVYGAYTFLAHFVGLTRFLW